MIGQRFRVSSLIFANVAGLKVGDPVMVSGVHRGRVQGVSLDRVGHVTVTLQLVDPSDRPNSTTAHSAK